MENEKTLENLDIFDDDFEDVRSQERDHQEPDTNNNGDGEGNGTPDTEDSLLSAYLRLKGIDSESIKMLNDQGETEEVNFNDLSREEQLQILNYNPAQRNEEDNELSDDEQKLLGILRHNNMSVKDYLNAYGRHVIEQYQATNQQQYEEDFDVNDYSDEELFIADLKDKVPDLTQEEAMQELALQQQNPDLFAKKMAGLRSSYIEREKQIKQYEEQQAVAYQAQLAEQFERVIVDTIQNNNSIDLGETSLDLSEDDMNEIASFILDSDAAGVRHIAKALNDPRMLVEMAWWALKGHDALDQITQYYKKQITDARRSAKLASAPSKPRTVVTKSAKKKQSGDVDFDSLYDDLF